MSLLHFSCVHCLSHPLEHSPFRAFSYCVHLGLLSRAGTKPVAYPSAGVGYQNRPGSVPIPLLQYSDRLYYCLCFLRNCSRSVTFPAPWFLACLCLEVLHDFLSGRPLSRRALDSCIIFFRFASVLTQLAFISFRSGPFFLACPLFKLIGVQTLVP
jgi:hypothetical protein